MPECCGDEKLYHTKNYQGTITKIPVTNSDGGVEIIEFARKNDRHKKGDDSSFRRTLGKLERQSNPYKMLLIANAEELTEISKFVKNKPSDNHQWLDYNGWEERETFAIFDDDKIYPAILHIAKAKDGRNILYDIGIKFNEGIDIAKDAATLQNASGQLGKVSTPSGESISQKESERNRQSEDIELTMESVTLPGNVSGFNSVQREYLVKALIEGVYSDSATIKVDVPYDGKFEIRACLNS